MQIWNLGHRGRLQRSTNKTKAALSRGCPGTHSTPLNMDRRMRASLWDTCQNHTGEDLRHWGKLRCTQHVARFGNRPTVSLKAVGQRDSSDWHMCGRDCHGWLDGSLQAADAQLKLVAARCGDAHVHTQHATTLMQMSLYMLQGM